MVIAFCRCLSKRRPSAGNQRRALQSVHIALEECSFVLWLSLKNTQAILMRVRLIAPVGAIID